MGSLMSGSKGGKGGGVVESSRVSVRGYTFLIEMLDRRISVFYDLQRGNKKVASVPLTPEAQKYSVERDKLHRKAGRLILDRYEAQTREAALGMEIFDGVDLSDLEIKKGVGLVNDKEYVLGKRGAALRNLSIVKDDE